MFRIALRRSLVVTLSLAFALGAIPGRAADESILRHLKGDVGYRAAATGAPTPVTGTQSVGDAFFAVTGQASSGLVELADSSVIGLGANTNVQIAAFTRAAAGNGTTIVIPAGSNGTLRFDIRRPAGGRSNYTFRTPTSSMSVRGTVGLLSLAPDGQTTIACLACAANDVAVTVGAQTYPLLTGQTLVISAAGIVTTIAVTTAILSTFSGAGVSTSASSGIGAATAGVGSAAGASAGAVGAAAGVAGAAAIGGAVAGSNNKSAFDQVRNGSPAPAATSTGTATIQGKKR